MKKTFFTTVVLIIINLTKLQAQQYSTYYNVDVNQRIDANINSNVNVSGTVYEHKTISTIDYGALQLANAQKEKNRLENLKYSDERQKMISMEIANDPIKAYDYGSKQTFYLKGNDAKQYGFKLLNGFFVVPHELLFVNAGQGRYENVSSDGITTEIIFSAPTYNKKNIEFDVEKEAKMDSIKVGELNKNPNNGNEFYIHKKDVNRATVYGVKGFKSTLIWEDDYEYTITDNYLSFDQSKGNGIWYFVKVRTYGDKDEITFEQLEGRRYYLKQLIERIISTAKVENYKY